MSLKIQIENDIKNVFLNTNEFADILNYLNVNISVVQDKDQLMKKKLDGQVDGNILIYAAVSDFENVPNVGDAVKLNDRKAQITDITEEDGMYEIILYENRR